MRIVTIARLGSLFRSMHGWFSAEFSREALCRDLEFSMQLFPSVLTCPVNSNQLGLPRLSASQLRESAGLSWNSLPQCVVWKLSHRLISFVLHLIGITILHCQMSSVLNTIVSYILPGFLVVSDSSVNWVQVIPSCPEQNFYFQVFMRGFC